MSLISRLYRLITGEPAVIKSTGAGTQADPAIPHVIIENTIEVADWDNITNKPTTYPPDLHGHDASEITGLDTLDGGASDWADITNKPTTFPPDTHGHTWSAIADKPTTFPPNSHSHTWATIADKPTTFPPDTHGHTWSAIADKPAVLGIVQRILSFATSTAQSFNSGGEADTALQLSVTPVSASSKLLVFCSAFLSSVNNGNSFLFYANTTSIHSGTITNNGISNPSYYSFSRIFEPMGATIHFKLALNRASGTVGFNQLGGTSTLSILEFE